VKGIVLNHGHFLILVSAPRQRVML
jgi:hypothetical protein